MKPFTLDDVVTDLASSIDRDLLKKSGRPVNRIVEVASALASLSSALPSLRSTTPDEKIYLETLPQNLGAVLGFEGNYITFSQVVAYAILQSFKKQQETQTISGKRKKGKILSSEELSKALLNLSERGFTLQEIVHMNNLFEGALRYASNNDVITLRDSFFRSRGFSNPQISKMYSSLPQIFGYNIGRMGNVQDKVEKVTDPVLEKGRLFELISHYPQIFGLNLYERVIPRLLYITESNPGRLEKNNFLRVLFTPSSKDNDLNFRDYFNIDLKDWQIYKERAIKEKE